MFERLSGQSVTLSDGRTVLVCMSVDHEKLVLFEEVFSTGGGSPHLLASYVQGDHDTYDAFWNGVEVVSRVDLDDLSGIPAPAVPPKLVELPRRRRRLVPWFASKP